MAWSPPARQRRSWLAEQAGDYAANISHHIRDGTAVRLRGDFPTDEAATKLPFLASREVGRGWKMPPREWSAAETRFAVLFGDRFL
jgi:transposase-like protein